VIKQCFVLVKWGLFHRIDNFHYHSEDSLICEARHRLYARNKVSKL